MDDAASEKSTVKTLSCSPVNRIGCPRYPSKLQTLNKPDLLMNNLPASWLKHPRLIGTASMLLAAGLNGCDKSGQENVSTSLPAKGLTLVAPVFYRGKGTELGRGMFACIAVASPVYMTEDDAWMVIQEELLKHGIHLAQRNQVIDDIKLPMQYSIEGYEWEESKYHRVLETRQIPIEVDGIDPDHNIYIEFISANYFTYFDPENPQYRESLCGVEIAASVRSMIKSQYSSSETTWWGIFYDPLTSYSFHENTNGNEFQDENCSFVTQKEIDRESVEANTTGIPESDTRKREWLKKMVKPRKISKACLRKQVQDFAEWLKAQGAI